MEGDGQGIVCVGGEWQGIVFAILPGSHDDPDLGVTFAFTLRKGQNGMSQAWGCGMPGDAVWLVHS